MARGKNKVEVDSERPEFSPMAYLVRAALGNRLELSACQEVADHLLNQVGVLADEHLEDLADFFRVVEREGINSFRILSEYRVNPEIRPVSEAEIERMIQIGLDHMRTVVIRRQMPESTIFDLDHTIEIASPLGEKLRMTLGEAWEIALLSPLEAFVKLSRGLARQGNESPDFGEVAEAVIWCRQAVGLVLFEQLALKDGW